MKEKPLLNEPRGFVLVLSGEDGVCEIAVYVTPFTKSAIIEEQTE